MTVTLSKTIDFIPEFNGNGELDPADQVRVTLKNLGVGEKESIRAQTRPMVRYDRNGGMEGMEMPLGADRDIVVRRMLSRIDNLAWEDDGGTVHPVTNYAQLKEAPMQFHGLLDEIYLRCMEVLSEEFRQKN